MAVVLPNIQDSPSFDGMAVPDSVDEFAASCDAQATGILSGMSVTQDTGLDMKIAVASGTVAVAGVEYTFAGSGSPFTVGAASASDRRDVVIYRAGTGVMVLAGTPCGTAGWTRTSTGLPPVKPAIAPSTDAVLAEIYVASTTTTIITATNLVDKRNVLGGLDVTAGLLNATTHVENIIRANSLDQMAPGAGNYSMGGHNITSLLGGTSTGQAAIWDQLPAVVTLLGVGTTSNDTTGSTLTTIVGANVMKLTATALAAGFLAGGGFVAVGASGGQAIVQYTAISGSTLTGLSLVSGTGSWTVTNGTTAIVSAFTVSVTGNYGSPD